MFVPEQKHYEEAYASICQNTCMGNCTAPKSVSITKEVKKRLFA